MIERVLMFMPGTSYAGGVVLNGGEAARLSTGVLGDTTRGLVPEYDPNWARRFAESARRLVFPSDEGSRLRGERVRGQRDSSRAAAMAELSARALNLRAPFA